MNLKQQSSSHTFSFLKLSKDEYRIVLDYFCRQTNSNEQLILCHSKESFVNFRDCMTKLIEQDK